MKYTTLILLLITQFNLTNNFNLTDTVKEIKQVLFKYQQNTRQRRSVINSSLELFVEKSFDFFNRTARYADYLETYNVSQCYVSIENDKSPNMEIYVQDHILNGLVLHEELPDWHWDEYKSVYNKMYETTHHEMTALDQWRENLRRVAEHNRQYMAGKQSYSLHLNHLGDLHSFDYIKKLLKLKITFPLFDPAKDHSRSTYQKNKHRNVPKQVDWRSKGFKPKLEEQLHCGACYAFAITHAVQAQLYKKHGDWKELSTQQIVDCSTQDGNLGCDGGSLAATFKYAARVGLILESNYPYIGKKGNCHYNRLNVRARPTRWATLPNGDEDAMEKALATIGPLAVAVNAAPFTFQLYRSGIYDDLFCAPWMLNHAMLLVGYTPEYWILLNWWGKKWGEDGYIRIRRGYNRCGVANMATYVEL